MRIQSFYAAAVAVAVSAVVFSAVLQPASARAVSIDLVPVGNPGNPSDVTGYGSVAYDYQIAKYDVTIGQYTEFLNAVAQTDTYSLYNTSMATNLNIAGISRTGTSGAYSYSVIAASGSAPFGGVSGPDRPITYASWFDSARFANWMSNGQPVGAQTSTTTEDGAYLLNGVITGFAPAKNVTNPNTGAAPLFSIPTENEWYKAAFYSAVLNSGSGGYYLYATQSDATPGNTIGSGPNQANYYVGGVGYAVTHSGVTESTQNYLTDVGAFTNSSSYYGTFDQSGNVYQWNDLTGAPGTSRGIRSGKWADGSAFNLSSTTRQTFAPSSEFDSFGFRLVAVPEPSTLVMGAAGLTCLGSLMIRRRRAR